MISSELRLLGGALLLLLGMSVAPISFAADSPSAAPIHLKFGISAGVNTAIQPVLYAKSSGLFDKYGVDVELVSMHDDTTAIQGQISGAYDLLFCGASPGMIALARGADIKIVGSVTPSSDYLFVAQSNIDSMKAMEGQTLGVSKVGSLSYLAAVFALKSQSVDLKKVTIVAAGNDSDRARMMAASQRITGGVLNGINAAQALSASSGKLHVIYDVGTAFRESLLGTAIFARATIIKSHPEVVERVVKALIESSRKLQSDKATAIAQAISTGLPAEAVQTTYDRLFSFPYPYYGVDGGLRRDVVEASFKLLKDDGDIEKIPDYTTVVDEQFIHKALEELGAYKQ